ncbi:hypothetical protein FisN_13Hu078 [Fistulifera solaris]|uniref:Uncharacterized protein n=1 Tax=Fistulifera solaris TaxID=1519565 RepID=A0A1Z5KNW3_FISSO|nr:hypothetical protein FisN_13Hu078 [Fistulifera solaris]|eukprot:GAX27815.1 hypothetical protein FisN_13Hu078 [Fistulifera solaris]
MPNDSSQDSPLLELIPTDLRTPAQVPRWYKGKKSDTYKLLRDPMDLGELNSFGKLMAIWREENETLTYVTPRGFCHYPDVKERVLSLVYQENDALVLSIGGKTARGIAQTLAYFMSLEKKKPTQEKSRLLFKIFKPYFNFSLVPTHSLTQAIEMAPSRILNFQNIYLSAEQSIVLTTRPHSMHLQFEGTCRFADDGKAFVDALEARSFSFGSLALRGTVPFHNIHLKRLFQVSTIDHLDLRCVTIDLGFLPFAARVNHLEYRIASSLLLKADLRPLKIAANKLTIVICHETNTFPSKPIAAFLRRLGDLGHFVELRIKFQFNDSTVDIPDYVAHELVLTVLANRKLRILDLSGRDNRLNWGPRMKILLNGVKTHKELCTIKVDVREGAFGKNYVYLRKLLNNNRNITVTDGEDKLYSNGTSIDELYSLNVLSKLCGMHG